MDVALNHFSLEFKSDKLVLARNTAHLMRKSFLPAPPSRLSSAKRLERVSELGQIISALSMITDGRAANLASAWHRLNLDHIVEQYMKSISCDATWVTKVLNEFGSWLDYLEHMSGSHTEAIRKMTSWLDAVIAPFSNEGILDTYVVTSGPRADL